MGELFSPTRLLIDVGPKSADEIILMQVVSSLETVFFYFLLVSH